MAWWRGGGRGGREERRAEALEGKSGTWQIRKALKGQERDAMDIQSTRRENTDDELKRYSHSL